jgi:hypothetical protein
MMVKFGKMVFVDLAGSERLKESKATGMTMTETGAINKSLFTLGKPVLDDYYFNATTLTIYFYICYFWLSLGKVISALGKKDRRSGVAKDDKVNLFLPILFFYTIYNH